MGWEAIKHPAFIHQRIDPLCAEALEVVPSALRCWAGVLDAFETCEFGVCGGHLEGSEELGEDHIAVCEDVVDERSDGGIFFAGEKGCASSKLDSVLD